MDLRDLKAFVTVAETRNLSRAAAALHVAQPALSRLVQDLEQELGVALLERGPKGVATTLAGDAFAAGARQVLAEIVAALDRAEGTAAGRRGRVVIGALRSVIAHGFITKVEDALRQAHPDIAIVLRELDFKEIIQELESGGIDLALSGDLPGTRDLVSVPLWEVFIDQALLPARHRLAAKGTVTLADLTDFPLVLGPPGYPPELLQRSLEALQRGGLRSPLLVLDVGLHGVYLAVAAGRGWTLVSRLLTAGPPQGTVVVPLENIDMKWNVSALWRFEERRPVVRTLLEAVFEAARHVPGTRLPAEPRMPKRDGTKTRRRGAGTLPPGLETRHLRALLGVAAAQTIGRAAERLGVTQPALSRQLQELEHVIDLPLLLRSARGVMLTAAGAALAGDCPPLLLAIERLVHDATRARREMEGRCVIGAVATAMTSQLLTRVLAAVGKRHPHMEIVIEEMTSPEVAAAVARGDLDLGLAHPFPGLGDSLNLEHETVLDDRIDRALVAADGPLAKRKRLAPSDLSDVPFLFVGPSFHPAFHAAVMGGLEQAGITPKVEGTYDGLRSLWSFVAQGKGWCPGFRSHKDQPPAGTVAVPIKKFDLPWGITMLRRKEPPSPAVQAVVEILTRTAARVPGPPRTPAGRARTPRPKPRR